MRPSHLQTRHKYDLSPRQVEVIELMARGRTNPEIADRLGITLDGAKYHVREILGKLNVESREEAVTAWRERPRPSPLRRFAFAFRGVPGWPVFSIAASAAALVLVLGLAGVFDSNASPSATEGEVTPPPSTPDASPFTPTVMSESASPSGCIGPSTMARLELEPDGDDVLVQFFVDTQDACQLTGRGMFWPMAGPPSMGLQRDPYANTEREFKVAITLPVSGPLIVWRWMNQCASSGPAGWTVKIGALNASVASGPSPACVAPGLPMIVAVESMAVMVDGESYPGDSCRTRVSGWLCEFATRTANAVLQDNLLMVIKQGQMAEFTCGPDGSTQGSEYSELCRGRPTGESVVGYPVTVHGSHGGPMDINGTLQTIEDALDSGPGAYLAGIGCPTQDPDCSTFILAFATRGAPKVAYLVFDLMPGREPAFVSAGISGDNADDILGGGTTMTRVGLVQFLALPPPP